MNDKRELYVVVSRWDYGGSDIEGVFTEEKDAREFAYELEGYDSITVEAWRGGTYVRDTYVDVRG